MNKKQLISQINALVASRLLNSGFTRERDRFVFPISQEFSGSVGLNIASHREDGFVGVSPIIGLESASIRRMLNQLLHQKADAPQPSLTSMIGYLMPEGRFVEWLFDPKQPVDQGEGEIDRMSAAINRYGLTFMRERASLEKIVNCLERLEFSFKERAVYHLPIGYRLIGNEGRAITCVEVQLAEIEKKSGMASEAFREFAREFASAR